jgi:hypothetical protein
MKSLSLAPVVVPQDGFAALPESCARLHNELGIRIYTFACGASQEVRGKLQEMHAAGQVDVLDWDSHELLTTSEMRNLASNLVREEYILYLDPMVMVHAQGVQRLVEILRDESVDFASPMLTRKGRVMFGGNQLRSIHRSNGDLAKLKLFDRDVESLASEVAPLQQASDSVHFNCFIARTATLQEVFRGWDERMSGLEPFDFALRARFHKLTVLVDSHIRFECQTQPTFDTHDRLYRAFCSAESFQMLARDAFELKWSAAAPSDVRLPRARKRDLFLRRSLQHRIDDALTRIARYQSPEPRAPWRELLLG